MIEIKILFLRHKKKGRNHTVTTQNNKIKLYLCKKIIYLRYKIERDEIWRMFF